MTQAHTAALESAQRTEDYQRADIEAILSAMVRGFLEDFDTVKEHNLTTANPTEDDRTGASLKAGIDAAVDGLQELTSYAQAIRSGEVHSWQ